MTHIALLFALSSLFITASSVDAAVDDDLADYFQRAGLDITDLQQLVPMISELKNDPLLAQHQENANHIIIDEIKEAFDRFINIKQKFGTAFEKEHYAEKTGDHLIKKCMDKKAIAFYGNDDKTILREGGITFFPPWQYIGNEKWEKGSIEQKEQILDDHLTYNPNIDNYQKWIDSMPAGYSYQEYKQYLYDSFNINNYFSSDEMELCVLLLTGGPTTFYNDGSRHNKGVIADKTEITEHGFIVEAVGPAFAKTGYQDHLLFIQQNVYSLIAKQVEMHRIIFGRAPDQHTKTAQWADMRGKPPFPIVTIFVDLLKERYRMAYLPYFLYVVSEIQKQKGAEGIETKACVSVTGLGAGVWAINNEKQSELIVEVIRDILDEFKSNGIRLNEYIDTIDFTYFATGGISTFLGKSNAEFHDQAKYNDINIVFSQNAPSSKKKVATLSVFELYPGNRNAAPGNSLYVMASRNNPNKGDMDKLTEKYMNRPTGAQAAAFSSDIILTQNPDINRKLSEKYIILSFNHSQSKEIRFGADRIRRRRILTGGGVRYLV